MPNVYQFKDFEGSSHRILIDLLRRHCTRRGMLVDLGAANGELGEAVRPLFDRTVGFEIDPDEIPRLRKRFSAAVIADLEKIPRAPGPAQAIVLADVLEHLRDARSLLAIVREALADDGRLFISVPNIANATIRVGLLFGVFRYRDRGILDTSHLRFYTLRTIREDVESSGFEILETRGSSVPLRLILPRAPEPLLRTGERLLTWLTAMWKGLFAYQIILVARRSNR